MELHIYIAILLRFALRDQSNSLLSVWIVDDKLHETHRFAHRQTHYGEHFFSFVGTRFRCVLPLTVHSLSELDDAPHKREAHKHEEENEHEIVILGPPSELRHSVHRLLQHAVRLVQVIVEVVQVSVLEAHLGAYLDGERPEESYPLLQLVCQQLVLLLL